jgi:raffinose/stachyose/melibiose transport system substrate-binding protein
MLKQLVDTHPFQNGFLGTPAQQGAGSAAGLIGNGKAAMELMGHWDPSVMNALTPDQKGIGDKLGWFPFPSVNGGAGAPDAALGGGDGFSCSVQAPPQCADFLKYLMSSSVQSRWAALGIGLPTNKGAVGAVTDPNLKSLVAFRDRSSFVQTYLDVAYGTNVGNALNDAVSLMFAGTATPAGVVTAVADAAATQ